MIKMQFEAGEGKKYGSVNYVMGEDENLSIYAEVEVPEGASDDYGYLAMKQAVEEDLAGQNIILDIWWQYDGQEQCLESDATDGEDIYVDIVKHGNLIKGNRAAAGITQQEMADIFEIPKRTISNWETHVNEPPAWAEKLIMKELAEIASSDKTISISIPNEVIKKIDILAKKNRLSRDEVISFAVMLWWNQSE